MKVSYYVTDEFLAPVVQDFFEFEIMPMMEDHGVENASVCVAIRVHDIPFEKCFYQYSRNVDPALEFNGPEEKIARSKAEISWRTGLSSREVVTSHPEYLRPGDTIHPGSTIRGGLIVAISGFPPDQHDESLSGKLAHEIWDRIMTMFLEERKQMLQRGDHFLPKPFTYTPDSD